ncbi:SEC-C motif-containing protein [Acinetobacter calcoaceticus]|uniref:SEC-C motif-containing protein n=1 Tax=Acinetobacter calcoaceticus TaxID=471 RepID=A0A4R1Y1X1_ACICA|nr:SEC-C motif-containing protein [Acinetobacter calcoaceticus]
MSEQHDHLNPQHGHLNLQQCPCGLGQYAQCCQPLHQGEAVAQSAEQLMRSRYSAFALGQIDYLLATTALGQQQALDRAAIASWSSANQWLGLEIVQSKAKLGKIHAQVEFKANYRDLKAAATEPAEQHHEISHFVLHQGRWYFLDPTTDQALTMKQTCICGSQKKFKQCCATYIL